MTIHPLCNVVSAAMAKTGLSYKDIAEKTGLSEAHVAELCGGKKLVAPEEHDAISKALGLTALLPGPNQRVCIGRAQPPEIPHPVSIAAMTLTPILIEKRHDAFDAVGLLHHHTTLAKKAIESVRHERLRFNATSLGQAVPLVLPDHLKISLTEKSVRAGLYGSADVQAIYSDNGLNPAGDFTWLKLKNIVHDTYETSRFDFGFDDPDLVSDVLVSSTCVVTAPDDKPLYEYPGARPICPVAPGDEDGPINVYRAYTPITERGAPGILSLAIKKQVATDSEAIYPGLMSNYIHNMAIGDTLGIMGYLQRAPSMTPWILNQYETVTLIAGGIGITPLLQVLQYSLAYEANTTKFLLLYANSKEIDVALRDELDTLQQNNSEYLKNVYTISQNPPPEDWTGEVGRIDEAFLRKWAPLPPATTRALVCVSGPPALLEVVAGPREGNKYDGFTGQGELKGYLKNIGYVAEQVHKF